MSQNPKLHLSLLLARTLKSMLILISLNSSNKRGMKLRLMASMRKTLSLSRKKKWAMMSRERTILKDGMMMRI